LTANLEQSISIDDHLKVTETQLAETDETTAAAFSVEAEDSTAAVATVTTVSAVSAATAWTASTMSTAAMPLPVDTDMMTTAAAVPTTVADAVTAVSTAAQAVAWETALQPSTNGMTENQVLLLIGGKNAAGKLYNSSELVGQYR